MSEVGEVLDIFESGYRLLVVGRVWAVIDMATGEQQTNEVMCDDYAAAKQAGLMAARIFVPDFGVFEIGFCDWMRSHHQEVVNDFLTTLEGDKGKYKLEDLIDFGRSRYAMAIGRGDS